MKRAVVLFNLGGPDSLDAVEPFLINLFSDPAITQLPGFLRPFLARRIAKRRAVTARGFYEKMGGSSPLLAETESQAAALEVELGAEFKVFIAMRYWHPFTEDVVKDVAAYDPDEVLLVPLYPQYSGTTTGSSLDAFHKAWKPFKHRAEVKALCCYFDDPEFISAFTEQVRTSLKVIRERHETAACRVLFSAHGLPQKVVDAGDPYAWQINEMAKTVISELGEPELDYRVCFQSRVGPVTWLKPYIDDEVRAAAEDKVGILVVPIAFVSEHSETLVELDIQYRDLAMAEGVPFYDRMPTLSSNPAFIKALAKLTLQTAALAGNPASASGPRKCPGNLAGCPCSVDSAEK